MLINDATRDAFRSPIAVWAIAAAMLLTASIQPGHAASDVFAAAFKESGSIASGKPIVSLSVPGGLYAIFGKINLDYDFPHNSATVVCSLLAGGDVDRDVSRLEPSGQFDNAAIRLQLVTELPVDVRTEIELSCVKDFETTPVSFRFAKISAIRLDGKRCEKPSPANCLPG
jgi:hypothetical protein